MGRKSQNKQNSKKASDKVNKVVQQKKRELTVLVAKLLKLTSLIQSSFTPTKSWEHFSEIKSIVDQIHNLESPAKAKTSTKRQAHLTQFTDWLKSNGAQFEGIEISEIEGYDLGLKASKDFTEGSLLLTVPRKLMMSETDAKESALNDFIETDPLLQHMPNITLALFLLLEKHNPDSFWKPYIDILPDKYSTVLYYTPEELLLLKPSPMLEASLKLYRNIARQYAYFYNKIHSMDLPVMQTLRDIFTYENYRWAVSTVMTRQNSIRLTDVDNTAFIPLWDMANHEQGKITTDFNKEAGRGECFALRDFKAGEQIFIFYGARPNEDLFLHNGFVYPNNEHDSLSLSLGVSASDVHRARRAGLLARLGLAAARYTLRATPHCPLSPELLAFIRVFNMDDGELTKWTDRGVPSELVSSEAADAQAVGAALDRKAYKYLRTRCQLLLAVYKKETVPEAKGDLRRTNIRLLKESEVQILENTIAYLDKVLEQLPEEKKTQ